MYGSGREVLGVRGLGLGFNNPGGTGGKWDMCLCFCCGGVEWSGWLAWTSVWEDGVVLSLYLL